MPNPHPPYPPEYRAEAVRLARESGKSLTAISKELGVSLEALRQWIAARRSSRDRSRAERRGASRAHQAPPGEPHPSD